MAPAGSWESLAAAINAGAGSVYFGLGGLNMRSASSANFSPEDLHEIVSRAHTGGVRCYLTLNTVIYGEDMEAMRAALDRAADAGVDAVIVSDMAALLAARERGLAVHISTQLNVSNLEAVRFYAQWADVVVLARELSLEQVAAIHKGILDKNICGPSGHPVRIEMFAHGALCMAVSGKCYMSLHTEGCSANRGECRQICRRSFILRDAETGDEMRAEGKYLLSPKDLCTIDFLDRFIGAGVSILKIEGRARPAEYVKRTVECYSAAADAVAAGGFTPELAAGLKERLREVFNRDFWAGNYLPSRVRLSENYGSSATTRKVFVGKITNFFARPMVAEIEVRGAVLEAGSEVLVTGATTGAVEFTAHEVRVDEKAVEVALQGTTCSVKCPETVRRGDSLYKIVRQ